METRVKDMLNLESLSGLKRLTKPGGLDNVVTKVGILEYEFTSKGRAFSSDEHWIPGEFILTSFQYAKDHPELITAAVKKMCQYKTSGMAIKNVFQTPIPEEAVRYANAHAYPLFVFTNHQLFFEDVILGVNQLIEGRKKQRYRENVVAEILFHSCNSRDIEEKGKIIAPFLSNKYQCVYLMGKDTDTIPIMVEQSLRFTECEVVRYKNGFFLLLNQPDNTRPTKYYLDQLGIQAARFYIGVSEVFYFRSRLRKALMQSIFAMRYSQLMGQSESEYKSIGFYQFLFPHQSDPWIEDYYSATIPEIQEYDLDNNTNLMETALLYEKYNGNLKEVAAEQNTHINTVRYRLKKLAELFHEEMGNPEFEGRLTVALKIYRMRQLCDLVGDLL